MQERLAGSGVRTAEKLANAFVTDLADVGIGEHRAEFLIGQAQSYVSAPSASSDETVIVQNSTLFGGEAVSADRLAAANDAVNNDDAVRLANSVGVAVRNALSEGGTPTAAQTAQITAQAGLPDVPHATQFVQVASAMGLSGQQAQAVIQDVQQNNALGSEIAGAIRSSLSNLTLSNGSQLDNAGMDQAVGLLEGAARSLVTAANTLNNGGGNTEAGDAATAGSTRPQTSANT